MDARKTRNATGLSTIRDVLDRTLARVGLDRRLEDYRVFEGWDEVVGATIARNAQPSRLDNKRLVVVVRSSAWLQELGMLRRDLCDRLNDWMGRKVIGEIFLVVGRLESTADPVGKSPLVGGRDNTVSRQRREPVETASPETPSSGHLAGDAASTGVSFGLDVRGMDQEIAAAFERLWRARKRRPS